MADQPHDHNEDGDNSSKNRVTEKPWGTSTRLWLSRSLHVELIRVFPGGYSSWHHHESKRNQFTLVRGRLFVTFDFKDPDDDEPRTVTYALSEPGDTICVEAGARHGFWTPEDAVCLEVYTTETGRPRWEMSPLDITRHTENGRWPTDAIDAMAPDLIWPGHVSPGQQRGHR